MLSFYILLLQHQHHYCLFFLFRRHFTIFIRCVVLSLTLCHVCQFGHNYKNRIVGTKSNPSECLTRTHTQTHILTIPSLCRSILTYKNNDKYSKNKKRSFLSFVCFRSTDISSTIDGNSLFLSNFSAQISCLKEFCFGVTSKYTRIHTHTASASFNSPSFCLASILCLEP